MNARPVASMCRPLPHVVAALLLASACGGPRPAPTLSAGAAAAQGRDFDVLITNGRVVDGTGAPWFRADVGITGDRITAIGNLSAARATTRIDAPNRWSRPASSTCSASPNSTSSSTRAPPARSRRASPPRSPARESSIAPVNDALAGRQQGQLRRASRSRRTSGRSTSTSRGWRSRRPAINVGTFVGAGGLRAYVIGKDGPRRHGRRDRGR